MKALPFLILFFAHILWAQMEFQDNWIHWKSPTLQIIDITDQSLSTQSLCDQLTQLATHNGRLDCRVTGDWLRDSAAQVYLQWLAQNTEPHVRPRDLAPKDTSVIRRMRHLDDQYLLVFLQNSLGKWALLFVGSASVKNDRPAEHPIALYHFSQEYNVQSVATFLAQKWFARSPYPRLDAEKRAALALQSNSSYAPPPPRDYWIGMDVGRTRGTLPLFPKDWWRDQQNDQVRNYRYTQDTSSAWNILEDESNLYALRSGFTWSGFVGMELLLLQSHHPVKFDMEHPDYLGLEEWSFDRYEVGATAHWLHRVPFHPSWEWHNEFFVGFHYSFLKESIQTTEGVALSDNYANRIHFESFYKGALAGFNGRLLYAKKLGLSIRTGFNSRSRNTDDTDDKAQIVARTTLDFFATLGVEYHWTQEE